MTTINRVSRLIVAVALTLGASSLAAPTAEAQRPTRDDASHPSSRAEVKITAPSTVIGANEYTVTIDANALKDGAAFKLLIAQDTSSGGTGAFKALKSLTNTAPHVFTVVIDPALTGQYKLQVTSGLIAQVVAQATVNVTRATGIRSWPTNWSASTQTSPRGLLDAWMSTPEGPTAS